MRRIFINVMVFYLAFWSVIIPNRATALTLTKIKCEEMPNKYWTPQLARNYARVIALNKYGWGRGEYKALNKLWTRESHWNASAYNSDADRWSGEHAGGIPQLLALDPRTPAPLQIERGLAYISSRYNKPSIAWGHHRNHGWY